MGRKTWIAGLVLITWAASGLLARTSAGVGDGIEHVIHVTVDGLRADTLLDLIEQEPGLFPNFIKLQTEGASTFNARTDYTHTLTIPNHASVITGRPVSQPAGMPNTVQHGYTNNFPRATDTLHNAGNPNVDYIHSVFDVAHDHGLSTGYFVTKDRLTIYGNSYNAANGAADTIGEDNGTAKIDITVIRDQNTPQMLAEFTERMTTDPLDYAFMHITDTDTAGHASGWISLAWDDAAADVDRYIGQVFDLVAQTPALQGSTAIILTADHGGGVPTTNHTDATAPVNYTIPMFLWGTNLPAGTDLYEHFTNRTDPLATRPTHVEEDQPLRNGDTGNMALALLGLEPIPGSLMQPRFTGGGPPDPLDFNNDGAFTVEDLDALTAAIGSEPIDPKFDLDHNNSVDGADLEQWLTEAATKNGLSTPYALGDTNLDGLVDDADRTTVLANLFTSSTQWSLGNINADGVIDGYDFNLWLSNRSAGTEMAAVPEPASGCGAVGLLLLIWRRRPKR
jgi:hypothetical protein